jgi:hypothetical protein
MVRQHMGQLRAGDPAALSDGAAHRAPRTQGTAPRPRTGQRRLGDDETTMQPVSRMVVSS